MRKSKRLRKLARVLAVVAATVAVAVGVALYVMARKDSEHAKFFETGRSVNNFLSGYTKAIREGFAKSDASRVTALNSERFYSSLRGRLALQPDAEKIIDEVQ